MNGKKESRKMNTISKKIEKLISAIIVSAIAFFELCLTGRADYSYRIARIDDRPNNLKAGANFGTADNPQMPRLSNYLSFIKGADVKSSASAPIYFSRLIIIIAIAALMIVGALLSVEPSTASMHTVDGEQRIQTMQENTGMGTEPPSTTVDDKIAIIGCFIASIMIIGGIYLNIPRKESRYGQRKTQIR